MNYILSEDQYQHLITLAQEKGLEDIETVLRAAIPAPSLDEINTASARARLYDEIVTFNATLNREFPHLKDVDVTAWIREDRER